MARTLPSEGMSPIDGYLEGDKRPVGYFEHVCTLDNDSYGAVRVKGTPTMVSGARYAAVKGLCYPLGSAGTWAGAVQGHLEQSVVKAIDGYMAAGLFSIENSALACSTAAVISLSWKNKATSGFGGVMHSFIQIREYSTVGYGCKALFEMPDHDATAAAGATKFTCAAGAANACSHVVRVTIGGVPYWMMMDSTPPA